MESVVVVVADGGVGGGGGDVVLWGTWPGQSKSYLCVLDVKKECPTTGQASPQPVQSVDLDSGRLASFAGQHSLKKRENNSFALFDENSLLVVSLISIGVFILVVVLCGVYAILLYVVSVIVFVCCLLIRRPQLAGDSLLHDFIFFVLDCRWCCVAVGLLFVVVFMW